MKKYVNASRDFSDPVYDVWVVDDDFERISFEGSFDDYDEAEEYVEDRGEHDDALLAIFETTLM